MMDTAARRLPGPDRGSQRRQDKPCIDLPTERIANHPARPGDQDHIQVDEAGRDANVRDIANPQLIGAVCAEATGMSLSGELRFKTLELEGSGPISRRCVSGGTAA